MNTILLDNNYALSFIGIEDDRLRIVVVKDDMELACRIEKSKNIANSYRPAIRAYSKGVYDSKKVRLVLVYY